MSMNRTLFAAVATVAGLLSTAATAAESPAATSVEVASVVVPYGDLNLNSERGVQQLQRRLVAAAKEVCGRHDPRDLRLAGIARDCMDGAISRAVAEVGNARLAQINAGRAKSLRG
jgi:UrcA family protein